MSQTFEEWHAFIAAQLGEPIEREERAEGATHFTSGNPPEVIVALTPSLVTVWEYAVTWQSPYSHVPKPRLIGTLRWRRVGARSGMKVVQALIEGAKASRRAKFRTCQHCQQRRPPEWMHELDICIACAQTSAGGVH